MAQISTTFLIALGLSSNLIMTVQANEFLKGPPNKVLDERVSEDNIQTSLLDEVENSLGKGSASNRLSQMEATLKPIVAALPKNAYGNLEHSGVSYALHRLFVLRRGWVIKGLAEGVHSNASSPAGVLKDQVPAFIQGLFEQRLAGKGFGLHDLAVLAATIEHLIHNEAVSRLGAAFNVHMLPVTSPISKDDASEVLDTYMMAYIMAENLNNMTLEDARQSVQQIPELFLAWNDTQKFVLGVRTRLIKDDADVDFAALAKVVETIGEEFGTFQDQECKQMTDTLVKMEYRGTGRVRLSDFYKPALDGAWTFQESSGYLRSLGALDETDALRPSVMISNYVSAAANCIASSGFYSVCCKNECEGLLGHLEQNIGAPEAGPSTIAALTAKLPSRTVSAPRDIPAALMQRLNDIAASHGGRVPLHGRLFAQWLHHVYPRECPYPHMSETSGINKRFADWYMESDNEHERSATQEEMQQHVANDMDSVEEDDLPVEELMPWSHEEELFVVHAASAGELIRPTASMPATIRSLLLLAAAGSIAFSMIHGLNTISPNGLAMSRSDKYFV